MAKPTINYTCYAKQGMSITGTPKSVLVPFWTLTIPYWVEIKIID